MLLSAAQVRGILSMISSAGGIEWTSISDPDPIFSELPSEHHPAPEAVPLLLFWHVGQDIFGDVVQLEM